MLNELHPEQIDDTLSNLSTLIITRFRLTDAHIDNPNIDALTAADALATQIAQLADIDAFYMTDRLRSIIHEQLTDC